MQISPALLIPVAVIGVVAGGLVWQGRIPFRYNVRNLVVRWKTTLLTILAFVAVNALLVVMMAFVNGMYQLTDSSGNPANVVVLSEGATDESFSNLQFTDAGELENHSKVARDNGRPMCSREAYLVVNQPIPDAPPGRPKRRFLQLRGVDDPVLSAGIHDLPLYAGGRWFSQAGVQLLPGSGSGSSDRQPAIEVVLGEVLLPATREVVRSVDLAARTMVVELPEGLLGAKFYRPGTSGFEKVISDRIREWEEKRRALAKKPS